MSIVCIHRLVKPLMVRSLPLRTLATSAPNAKTRRSLENRERPAPITVVMLLNMQNMCCSLSPVFTWCVSYAI